MLQKELNKTTRKTTGKIDYIGPYSKITVDIVKNAVISMSAEPTALTNGNVTVTITHTLPEDKKGEKDKIVLLYSQRYSRSNSLCNHNYIRICNANQLRRNYMESAKYNLKLLDI